MKRTISSVAVVLALVFGGIIVSGVVAQQCYSPQSTYSSQVAYGTPVQSAPRYTTYESTPVAVRINNRRFRFRRQTYSAPVSRTPVYSSSASYSNTSNYSTPSYSSAPVTYSPQVTYASPTYASPSVSYPSNPVTYSSAPVTYSSAPVTYSSSVPVQTYSSGSYPSQSSPAQTYATASNQVSPTYVQPTYSQPQTYSQTYTSSRNVVRSQPINQAANYQPVNYSTTYSSGNQYASTSSMSSGLAQQKAARAAQMGLRGHLGGGLGGAKYEGVGWSNQSAQRAIESCCYWGQRPTAQIGCTRGSDGFWYACVLYH